MGYATTFKLSRSSALLVIIIVPWLNSLFNNHGVLERVLYTLCTQINGSNFMIVCGSKNIMVNEMDIWKVTHLSVRIPSPGRRPG